jgi:hypothetical protein
MARVIPFTSTYHELGPKRPTRRDVSILLAHRFWAFSVQGRSVFCVILLTRLGFSVVQG